MHTLRFTITSPNHTPLVLSNSPIGWNDNFIKISRSSNYHGFFRSYSQTLKFVGDGAQKLREIFYNYEPILQGSTSLYNSLACLEIEILDTITLTYSTYFRGDFDFQTFVEDTENKTISILVVEGGLSKLLKKNEGVQFETIFGQDVNLLRWEYGTYGAPTYQEFSVQITEYFKQLFDFICCGGYTGSSTITGNTGVATFAPNTFDIDVSYFTADENSLVLFSKSVSNFVPKMTSSFQDLFNSLNVLKSIGAGIEVVNNKETLVIREKEYFYDNATIISDFGKITKLEIKPYQDVVINEIAFGFPQSDYSDNFSSKTTTVHQGNTYGLNLESIPAPKKLDLISKYRADWQGIKDILYNNLDSSDIWFLKIYVDPDPYSVPQRYIPVPGLMRKTYAPVITYELINAELSHSLIAVNHEQYFNSIFYGVSEDSQLEFKLKSSDVDNISNEIQINNSLVWHGQQGILGFANDLYFKPILFAFEADIETNFLTNFTTNSKGIYTFQFNGNTFSGFLLETQTKASEECSANVTLLCSAISDLKLLMVEN